MADNNNLKEENSFYLDPNIQIKRSYSYTNYLFFNRSIDTQNNPINRKYIGQFVLGDKLGQGTFGVVVLGTHQITGEKVAVKILDKEKILQETDKFRLEREIKILKNMRHNNIVHLYDVKETPTSLYIIMEYIPGKELFDYIIYNKRLSELEACKFYQQIISGVEYLGKIKVVHRDLKPENLLLDNKNNIKIVDFGLSNSYPKNELLTTACGSPCYAAPEMINGERYYGLKTDIWSSGIVLYAMLCGYLPFEEADNEKLYKKITAGKFKTPNFLSDSAKDFLHRILNIDPKSRITIPQMKKHPWFNLINPKLNMTEGLLLNKVIVPIDENIIYKMVHEYKFNGEEVRTNLLLNNHNHITTTYFLILNQKLRNGEKTIGNMKSKEFLKYIHSPINLLSHYGYNMKKIIQLRAKLIDEKSMNEEKDTKYKRNKNSINGLSAATQSGSTGIMNVGSSIEKLNKKEKRDSSVNQRKNYKIIPDENKKNKITKNNKNIPKSVDNKTKKNENKEKIKEKNNKICITPDMKIKQIKNNNNLNKNIKEVKEFDIINKNNKINNKKRNTDIKNKKNQINELQSEEKENRKNNNYYILEEIVESKNTNNNNLEIKENENDKDEKENKNNSNSKKVNKLNKKAITIKNVINNKKNRYDIILNDKKEIDKKKKIKKLVDKKNITERRMEVKSYNITNQNELNNLENEDIIVNTDINKYVKISNLMRRMKAKKENDKKNNSKRNKSSFQEDSIIKPKFINTTEREIVSQNKEIEKEKEKEGLAITDRTNENENKNYIFNIPKKRNIIANIYNYKYPKKNNSIRNKRASDKIPKKINKKFIDTSVSFDKTNEEIEKVNKESILITDDINHIEENEDSNLESSEEYKNNEDKNVESKNNEDKNNDKTNNDNSKNDNDNNDSGNNNIEKEEEELKKKEKDIKYLKLKSKHKKFNIVKTDDDKFNNSIRHTYKNNANNNILIRALKNPIIKNSTNNNEGNANRIINSKKNKYKNILLEKEKIKLNEKKHIINHHTTINDYQNYLHYSKKKYMTEKIGNKEDIKNNKNSNNSLIDELNNNPDKSPPDLLNKYKNKIISNNQKNKNTEVNYIFDDDYNNNNEIKIFDLNSINYYRNYNNIKEIKEKIKKELDSKKVKYNLKKNKYCCYYKKDNKFEIEIFPINEQKNIYIIKCTKKLGNALIIKDIYKFIQTKLNSS